MNTKLLVVGTLLFAGYGFSQNVGIAEPAPNSKLDVVGTETTGNTIEVNHNVGTNASSAVWVRNNGLGRALNAQNLNTALNIPVGQFLQLGTGATAHGVEIDMDAGGHANATGTFLAQPGLGFGHYVQMTNAASVRPGVYVSNAGTGDGITNWQVGAGLGIYNDVTAGNGIFNVQRSNSIGTINLMTFAGGTGEYVDLDVNDGVGVVVYGVDNPAAPAAGGDVWAFDATIRTATPTGAFVYGGGLYTGQSGSGHGVLVNHSGPAGRNAEFNIQNGANTDPAIFASNLGHGSAIQGQNQSNVITGIMNVADFAYTGTDVADHRGVYGFSAPTAGWGIGVYGSGGWYGVYCQGDMTATGTKPFTIDHPADPENKMLKHFAIESNEVLNMYRGVVQLNGNGEATVQLPDYFELINANYSYQLTAIGTPEPPYVLSEIQGNTFKVAGAPNTKVSWTVYADRNDPYMQQNPERGADVVDKTGERQGKYLMPELYGKPASAGMFYNPSDSGLPTSQKDGGTSVSPTTVNNLRQQAQNNQPVQLNSASTVDEP